MQSAEDVVQAVLDGTRRRRHRREPHSRGLLPCGIRSPPQSRARGPQGGRPLHALDGPASQLDAFGRARRGSRDVLTLLGSTDRARWSITTDFQGRPTRPSRTGVYDVMNERSFSDFVEKYWLFAAVPLAAALLCFGFAALLRRMVGIRTRELKADAGKRAAPAPRGSGGGRTLQATSARRASRTAEHDVRARNPPVRRRHPRSRSGTAQLLALGLAHARNVRGRPRVKIHAQAERVSDDCRARETLCKDRCR